MTTNSQLQDYAKVCDAATLDELSALGAAPARLLVAARIGKTRLIDNMGFVRR